MTPLAPDADERSLNLAIFGASSPVGRALVAQALDAGHRLTALTPHPERMPRDGALRVVHATPADVPALSDAILGVDAVLCALPAFARGSQDVTGAARAVANITRVMRDLRVRRLVALSSAEVVLPGDRLNLEQRARHFLTQLFAGRALAARRRVYHTVADTDLDWIVVRAATIGDGPATGHYGAFADHLPSPRISSGDVAHFMLTCAQDDTWLRRAPMLGHSHSAR